MLTLFRYRKVGAIWLLLHLLLTIFGSAPLQAAMIATETLIATESGQPAAPTLEERLAAPQARDLLLQLGVDPREVDARIAALTDSERAELATRVDALPAGGTSLVGVVILIFVVLITLDLLGATDIFPVIKPIGSK